jgi:hypothetical protein
MTTITKLEPKTFQGKITGYSVTLADGMTGYLDDKNSDKGLQVGAGVNYTSEDKVNKKGGVYKLLVLKAASISIPPPQQQQQYTPPPPPPQKQSPTSISAPVQDIVAYKVEASFVAMKAVMEAYKSERIDFPKVPETYKECCNLLYGEIDSIFGVTK